jgi:hypothetical protein
MFNPLIGRGTAFQFKAARLSNIVCYASFDRQAIHETPIHATATATSLAAF